METSCYVFVLFLIIIVVCLSLCIYVLPLKSGVSSYQKLINSYQTTNVFHLLLLNSKKLSQNLCIEFFSQFFLLLLVVVVDVLFLLQQPIKDNFNCTTTTLTWWSYYSPEWDKCVCVCVEQYRPRDCIMQLSKKLIYEKKNATQLWLF